MASAGSQKQKVARLPDAHPRLGRSNSWHHSINSRLGRQQSIAHRMCFPTSEACLESRLVSVANRLPSILCPYLMYETQYYDSHWCRPSTSSLGISNLHTAGPSRLSDTTRISFAAVLLHTCV